MTLLRARSLSLPRRLFDVSLELRAGEIACLIGPNGSGKTSLLHAIAGIGRPEGSVTIQEAALHRMSAAHRARLLTFMPASRDVRWPLAARDLIALGGASKHEAARAVAALELDDFLDRRVDRLSTGERSRVLLARALAPTPKVLLLDEPLANLDPLWQLRLPDLLRKEINRSARAALIAVHDLASAGAMADRLIVMDGGRVAADGAPAEILAGAVIPKVFGIERVEGAWRPVRQPEDRRSSP